MVLTVALAATGAAFLAQYLLRTTPAPRLTLQPRTYDQLPGWATASAAAAVPAFVKSCAVLTKRPGHQPLHAAAGADFGRIGEWRPLCAAAATLPAKDDAAARKFFEMAFQPLLAGNNGAAAGLFTGYFEIVLSGSRRRGGASQTPLYRKPADPARFSRAEIEDGGLAGQGLELLWVDSPVDAFFLEIQGSGVVRLHEGGSIRVNYAAGNGRPYVAVGRLLLEREIIPRERLTMASLRAWMVANPQDGAALRRENPSYVFFRELAGDGPVGSQQVVLTPRHSLAVDRRFIPLGVPIWLDAQERFSSTVHRRLVIAQDTGGAIKGPVRGDLYWGSGDKAGAQAGAMNARGQYYVLLPRAVAARLAQTRR